MSITSSRPKWFNESFLTQTCSGCGLRCDAPKRRAGLGIREWTCMECSTYHDRDVNAAKNMLALWHQRLAGGIIALKGEEDVKLESKWMG